MASANDSSVVSSDVTNSGFRLDASAFLRGDTRRSIRSPSPTGQTLSEFADVYTVYIQTPILNYVVPFAQSRPYLTTSELGEYQRGEPSHVSLVTDPRLLDWEVKQNYIVLSRSGRVGEAYWIDRKLAGALVGDSFRVVPGQSDEGFFLYSLLSSQYSKDYMTGVSYGSVVDHASVNHARMLPVPCVDRRSHANIIKRVKNALAARENAYELLDAAEAAINRCCGLHDLRLINQIPFDPLGQPDCFDVRNSKVNAVNSVTSEYRLDAHFYNQTAQHAVDNIKKGRAGVKTVGKVSERVFFCNRFTRTYVDREHGIPYLAGKNIVQIRPSDLAYLSKSQTEGLDQYRLQKGWILLTCSGTIGRTCLVWQNYEEYVATHDLIRIVPNSEEVDGGYLYAFLSSEYGKAQILRFRHGSVIDHVTPEQVERVLIPCPSPKEQEVIGDMVREAYEKRAEAIRLEDEAQEILMNELTRTHDTKGE
jgi:type I restriction enzyme S subunit